MISTSKSYINQDCNIKKIMLIKFGFKILLTYMIDGIQNQFTSHIVLYRWVIKRNVGPFRLQTKYLRPI